MSLVDQRNWEDYNHAFNQTFQALDQDLTDPNRFPKGRKYFTMFPICFRYDIKVLFCDQTKETAMATGAPSKPTLSMATSSAQLTPTVRGSPNRFRRMSW